MTANLHDLIEQQRQIIENNVQRETFESIAEWAQGGFGKPELDAGMSRITEEWDEMADEAYFASDRGLGFTPAMVAEAADVVIVMLHCIPGLPEAIRSKMVKNRARKWRSNGDGTAQHVREGA